MLAPEPDQQSSESGRPRHAGFWIRLFAGILDILIMGIPLLLALFVIFGSDPNELAGFDLDYTDASGEAATTRIALSVADVSMMIVIGVITILLWVNWDGRTPGKKLTHIRIVSYPDYKPFSYGRATLRTVLSVASALSLFIGYVVISLMVGQRKDKRGFHDLVAKTCVIHEE